MIVGIGLDIVETARWARALEGGEVEDRVFTPGELAACAGRADRVEALAARFAAKEACLKALGAGIREGALRQVEIVSGSGGAPQMRVTGPLAARAHERGVCTAHLSLTHEQGFAAAVVILEGTQTPTAAAPEPWTLQTVASGTW